MQIAAAARERTIETQQTVNDSLRSVTSYFSKALADSSGRKIWEGVLRELCGEVHQRALGECWGGILKESFDNEVWETILRERTLCKNSGSELLQRVLR